MNDGPRADEGEGRAEVPFGEDRPPTPRRWSPAPSLWLISSCILSGMFAEIGGYNTLWGGGGVFGEYAFGFWMAYGMMHIPGLALGYLALKALASAGRDPLILFRYLTLGLFLAGIVMDYDTARGDLHGSPPWLFLMVDGGSLFLFTFMFVRPQEQAPRYPAWWPLAALLLAPGLALGSRVQHELTADRPIYSVWQDIPFREHGLEVVFVEIREPADHAGAECARALQMAPAPHAFLTGRDWDEPAIHRILLLYATREDMWSMNPTRAAYQVAWSPDGIADCRQQHIDYLPVEGVRADSEREYPWPTGRPDGREASGS